MQSDPESTEPRQTTLRLSGRLELIAWLFQTERDPWCRHKSADVGVAPRDMAASPTPKRLEDGPRIPCVTRRYTARPGRRRKRAAGHRTVSGHLRSYCRSISQIHPASPSQLTEAVMANESAGKTSASSPLDDSNGRIERTRRPLPIAVADRHAASGRRVTSKCPLGGAGDATVRRMSMMRLYRVILPVDDVEAAARFDSTLFDQSGVRVSPGRHYFACGDVTIAVYCPHADGDDRNPRPNFDHAYFAVDDLEEVYRRAERFGRGLSPAIGDGRYRLPLLR